MKFILPLIVFGLTSCASCDVDRSLCDSFSINHGLPSLTATLVFFLFLFAAGDVYTTKKVLELRGGRELNPLYGSHPSQTKMIVGHVISLVALFAFIWWQPRIKLVALTIGVVVYFAVCVNNYFVLRRLRSQS